MRFPLQMKALHYLSVELKLVTHTQPQRSRQTGTLVRDVNTLGHLTLAAASQALGKLLNL